MPNKKAAFKSLRQDKKKQARNHSVKSELRTLTKKVRALIEEKDRDKAEAMLKKLESRSHKAAQNNIIKKNTASRNISRLRHHWASIESK